MLTPVTARYATVTLPIPRARAIFAAWSSRTRR